MGRHTGADSVRDLHALLAAADVRGPYMLLGFSLRGLLAAMYAGTYPDEVMGILMLDASLPTDDQVDALIPAGMRAQVEAEQEGNAERVEFYRTLDQAGARLDTVPDVRSPTWPRNRWSCPASGRCGGCGGSSAPTRRRSSTGSGRAGWSR